MSKKSTRKASKSNLPRSVAHGPVRLGGVTIYGHVLDDGRRVFSARDLVAALSGALGPKNAHFERSVAALQNVSGELNLGPRIEFSIPGSPNGFGYPVEVFTAVCRAYVRADRAGTLHHKQKPVADRAWAVLDALGDIGIIALVDEATGFQKQRAKTALQDALALLLRESAGPYQVLFSEEFFAEVARLYRITLRGKNKRPRFFGWFIKHYFYEWLSPAMYAELCSRLPANDNGQRPGLMHPHLTDGAREIFGRHQDTVVALMRTSGTPREFDERFGVACKKHPLQLRLPN